MPKRKLADGQIAEIAEAHKAGRSLESLAAEYGVQGSCIAKRLKRRGLFVRENRDAVRLRLTKHQISDGEIAARYQAGESTVALAAALGCSSGLVGRRLERGGVARRAGGTRYTVNGSAFDTVTQESAYWVGFMMADGDVHYPKAGNSPSLGATVQTADRAHLELFREFLSYTGKVYHGRGKSRLQVCSRDLVEALSKFGVLPRKSLTAKAIGLENDRHFWRGVVDGDGHVSAGRRGRPCRLICLAGSRNLLEQFADFVRAVAGGERPKLYPHSNIFQLYLYGDRASRVAEVLYDGCSVALARKLAQAEKMFGLRGRANGVRPRSV